MKFAGDKWVCWTVLNKPFLMISSSQYFSEDVTGCVLLTKALENMLIY